MSATEILVHEHDLILKVIAAAEKEVEAIETARTIRAERIEKMVDFFRNFADHCHHAKEEKRLFPRMQQRGLPVDGGPIAVMLMEHDQGRFHISNIVRDLPTARDGNEIAVESLQGNLAAFCELLKHHIMKENNILFPMVDRLFTPDDQRDVLSQFEETEKNEIGEGVHEKYRRLAEELAQD